MSFKHFLAGSVTATAVIATIALVQGMSGSAPDESRYLPTINSAMAMRVVGAGAGLRETGWQNDFIERRIAGLEGRVRPELRARFEHIRSAAYDEAISGEWNEAALEQSIGASLVGADTLLGLNAGVFNAVSDAERTIAQTIIFDQYGASSPYTGVAFIQMGELTMQLHDRLEDAGMLRISQADPGAVLSPGYRERFNEILEGLSVDGQGPVSRAEFLADAPDPFGTSYHSGIPGAAVPDPFTGGATVYAENEKGDPDHLSVTFAF